MSSPSMLSVTTAQYTHAGRKASNDDSMGLFVPTEAQQLIHKGISAVIADGVSAADAGMEAAETCVQNFLSDYFSTPDCWTVQTAAQKVLTALNRWLYGQGARFGEAQKGYVCTLSILVIKSRTAYLFHIGDTRIHIFREGVIRQLTTDHAIQLSKGSTYLSRAMGLDTRADVDFKTWPVRCGDLFLLTSDGIHDHVSHPEMASILSGAASLEAAAEALAQRALDNDSQDNLTCQLVRVDALPDVSVDEYLQRIAELPFAPDLSPAMILDGFRIERELHSSRRSQIYVVTEVKSGRRLVMKTPSVNYEDDPAYIDRFVLEQWIGSKLKSKHLLKSVPLPAKRSCLYNLSEYIDGETFEAWIGRYGPKLRKGMGSAQQVEQVVALIGQVVRGLIALHRKETIHQDLKPANIMIDREGCVKIIDFGSCYVAGIDEIATPIVRDKILGTASYAAPEYWLGYSVGALSDLYSLACIAYEMLTGKHPYGEAAEEAKTQSDFQRLVYTPAYLHNPHVPVWMDGALKKGLAVNPADRYSEITEFIFDLEHPNPEFLHSIKTPLLNKQWEHGWRTLALLLLLTQALSLWALMR